MAPTPSSSSSPADGSLPPHSPATPRPVPPRRKGSEFSRAFLRLFFPVRWAGLQLGDFFAGLRRLTAFTLITLSTAVQKWGVAPRVIHPLIREQILRAGVRLLPLVCLLGLVLGFSIVGQLLVRLNETGQPKLFSKIIGPVVVRELGPMAAMLVVLTRVGTAMVTELGTARALGEVEALEALGIDPIHFLVVPRVIGLTISVVALTLYLIGVALLGGFLLGFCQGSPVTLSDYFSSLAGALSWLDFPMLGLKTLVLGGVNALIICYQGLAEPLRLEEVGDATARTVAQCFVAGLLIDVLFLAIYFFV